MSTNRLATRTLGTQGLTASSIGLGLMGMSQAYGTDEERDERESIATIHRAVELGCTFLDTAEVYGPYVNEELLARALIVRASAAAMPWTADVRGVYPRSFEQNTLYTARWSMVTRHLPRVRCRRCLGQRMMPVAPFGQATRRPARGANEFAAGKSQSPPARTRRPAV